MVGPRRRAYHPTHAHGSGCRVASRRERCAAAVGPRAGPRRHVRRARRRPGCDLGAGPHVLGRRRRLAQASKVKVARDVTYLRDDRDTLTLDVFLPPNHKPGATHPTVVFLNAIGDADGQPKLKRWGIYQSWPRLVATYGMTGISMDADRERPLESMKSVFAFLEREGARTRRGRVAHRRLRGERQRDPGERLPTLTRGSARHPGGGSLLRSTAGRASSGRSSRAVRGRRVRRRRPRTRRWPRCGGA